MYSTTYNLSEKGKNEDISVFNELVDSNEDVIEFDYVTKCIGSLGRWQYMCCLVTASARMMAMWNIVCVVFLIPPTQFNCTRIESNLNATRELKESTCYDGCVKYEYKSAVFEKTVVSDFDLVCDKEWLASLVQMVLMFGVLVGTTFYGYVSDRFGRQKGIRICVSSNVALMIAAAYSPKYTTLVSLRFFIGMSSGGILVCCPVYFLEIVGTLNRSKASAFNLLPDVIATATLPIFAYFSSTWNSYMFKFSIVSTVFLIATYFLPESPRWLISKGRVEEAMKVINKAATCNKMPKYNIRDIITKYLRYTKINEGKRLDKNILDLFKTKDLALKTIGMIIVFAAANFIYYAILLFIPNIGPNIYLDVSLIGLIQIVPCFLSVVVNNFVDRKIALIGIYLTTSVCMGSLAFVPKGHWVATVLGLIAMGIIDIAYAVIYIYTSELFPTSLRSMALGVVTSGAKIGAMFMSFIVVLKPNWVPPLIFSLIPCVALLPLMFLHETRGQDLKDFS